MSNLWGNSKIYAWKVDQMKITFEFNKETHAFRLEPETELETQVLRKMAEDSGKGKSVTLAKIETSANVEYQEFRVEIKVNGK